MSKLRPEYGTYFNRHILVVKFFTFVPVCTMAKSLKSNANNSNCTDIWHCVRDLMYEGQYGSNSSYFSSYKYGAG